MSAPPPPLRVLVVDDSALVREVLGGMLAREGHVVDIAADPIIAFERIKKARPDVILLDLEMPRMDGLTFLRSVMSSDPIPVVVCSALTGPGTEAALRALEEGAIEIVTKPRLGVQGFLEESATLLADSVRAAARARVRRRGPAARPPEPSVSAKVAFPAHGAPPTVSTDRVVVVAASTGGTEALGQLLKELSPDAPGLVIVQHMPEVFTAAFARRLNEVCTIEVKEAENGDPVREGRALVAPGNRHTRLRRTGTRYSVEVTNGPLVSRHRPSADVLFWSTAQAAGVNAVGAILTGMGTDGADGLLEMKLAGAHTIAQDEASCVVFGMPGAAIARGAVCEVQPLSRIAGAILRAARAERAVR
ncbi:MAG TPA: chemotaxis response regulator protein-glutamate methylesterase [Thermoanaerobaculia bacterium]|nr:chemotaxis response regulator protein-glutamate methylesterase [Thermoanaerobaculia bacterium]